MAVTPKSNSVVLYGSSEQDREILIVAGTVTEMKPGRLVKKGADDNHILICGADEDAIGVLGYEDTPAKYQPATLTTAYAVGDHAAVHKKGGLLGELSDAGGVNKGQALYVVADGKVSKVASTSKRVYAIADSSRTNAGAIAMRVP